MNEQAAPALKYHLTAPGMGSDHWAGIVTHALRRLDGIADIRTSVASHEVAVTMATGGPDASLLRRTVENAGYDVAAARKDTEEGVSGGVSVRRLGDASIGLPVGEKRIGQHGCADFHRIAAALSYRSGRLYLANDLVYRDGRDPS